MIIADGLAPYRHQAIGSRHFDHIATDVTFVDKLWSGMFLKMSGSFSHSRLA